MIYCQLDNLRTYFFYNFHYFEDWKLSLASNRQLDNYKFLNYFLKSLKSPRMYSGIHHAKIDMAVTPLKKWNVSVLIFWPLFLRGVEKLQFWTFFMFFKTYLSKFFFQFFCKRNSFNTCIFTQKSRLRWFFFFTTFFRNIHFLQYFLHFW